MLDRDRDAGTTAPRTATTTTPGATPATGTTGPHTETHHTARRPKPASVHARTPQSRASSASVHPVQPVHASTTNPHTKTPTRQPQHTKTTTPETLDHAIRRMRHQGYSVQQVAGEIRRWHPGISPAQARSMVRAVANPVPHVTRTATPPQRAPRTATPIHASHNCTPLVHTKRHESLLHELGHTAIIEGEAVAPTVAGVVAGGVAGVVTLNPIVGIAAGVAAAGATSFAVSRTAKHESWRKSAEHATVEAAIQAGGDLGELSVERVAPSLARAEGAASLAARRKAAAGTAAVVIRISVAEMPELRPR